MPATNYTPIQLYRSTTSGNIPNAANLSAGEKALNIADNDMTMYFENASGTVKRFFNNPAALKYPTADGTSGQFLTTNGAGVLSFGSVAAGALTNNTRQAVTSSATTTLNLNSGNVIDLTMAANITTLSFTNVPASGTPILVQIIVKNASDGTAYTITWPNSVYWSGQYAAVGASSVQTAPALATGPNGVTVIALLTTDGGTKWRGWVEATIPGGAFGSIYGWGYNSGGSGGGVGDNTSINRSSPVQVGSLTSWVDVTAGQRFILALKSDGTLWAWGQGLLGSLGQNNGISASSPVQVGALTGWTAIAATRGAALAINNGNLFSWGQNTYGETGTNTNAVSFGFRSSPVQIGAGQTWASVAGGLYHAAAITTTGQLWTWGKNFRGQLGQNDTTYRSSPVQVGSGTTWSKISCLENDTFAIKTDGTLWFVGGLNSLGSAGLNDTLQRSSPVQIGALTTWSKLPTCSGQSISSMAAINSSGQLFTWGRNNYGVLGRNSQTECSSPIQVGALTTWNSVTIGEFFMLASTTGGTLFSWGMNFNYGQLGQNNRTNISSPVQIGALTTWSQFVAAGRALSAAIGNFTTINPG